MTVKIQIDIPESGESTVIVDGKDVSESVVGLAIAARDGEPPVVQLLLTGDIEIVTESGVTTLTPEPTVLEFLNSMNPGALETAALEASAWGSSDNIVSLVLDRMKVLAGGNDGS